MKPSLFTFISIIAGSFMINTQALAQATSAAHPKPEYVFTVNMAVMDRCIKRDDIRIALENASYNENRKIGKRDVMRIMNTCERDLRFPRRQALGIVAAEALSYGECDTGTCSEDERENLVRMTVEARSRFRDQYADLMLHNIGASCRNDMLDTQCVQKGVRLTHASIGLSDYSWLVLNPDERIVRIRDDNADPQSRDMEKALDAFLTDFSTTAPSTLSAESVVETLARRGYESPSSKTVSVNDTKIRLTSQNGFVRADLTVDQDACNWILDSAMKRYSPDELIVNTRLATGTNDDACKRFRNEIGIAYSNRPS